MANPSYQSRRGQLETYFDRTAADAWARLTSDAPVSRVRATVRAGRDRMRGCLLDWMPVDLRGKRILDAGCGTGALSVEAAQRGAEVVAVDISGTLIELARERAPGGSGSGSITFMEGDMLDSSLGEFDYVVAMDSLIHYPLDDVLDVLANMAERTRNAILFTHAPRTPMLAAMHAIGQLFPRGDRSPAIEPVSDRRLQSRIGADPRFASLKIGRTERVSSGFYISQALELVR